MGERVYSVLSYGGKTHHITFSESDEEWGCLCTFPHNDAAFSEISKGRVAQLALFGAAVVLACTDLVDPDGECIFLPDIVPVWIRESIKEQLGLEWGDPEW